MNGETNEVDKEEVAEQVASPEQQPAQGGSPEEVGKQALTYIYGDAATFSSLIEMIKANKQNPAKGVAEAAVMIIEKLEADIGEQSEETLASTGIAVVTSLLDLANKAGIIPQVDQQIGSQAWGMAINLFMTKHPGRIDEAKLQQLAQQGGGAPAQAQPAATPAPEQEQGLLG